MLKEKNVVEDSGNFEPLTDYSKFKVDCEYILKTYWKKFYMVIVRPATVGGYSPGKD